MSAAPLVSDWITGSEATRTGRGSHHGPTCPEHAVDWPRGRDGLRALLAQNRTRLLTFTGPGGTGKTRLALELAAEIGSTYGQIWLVDLTTIRESGLVPGAIAHAVGVHETGAQPLPASD